MPLGEDNKGVEDPSVKAVFDLRLLSLSEGVRGSSAHIKQTFFVSTRWCHKHLATQVASYLEFKGLRWFLDHNWIGSNLDGAAQAPESIDLMQRNLRAAVNADLFVALPFDSHVPDCFGELSARVSHNKEVHLIKNNTKPTYLLYRHPCVIQHDNFDDFLRRVFSS